MTKQALISVSNKENIVAFAESITELGYEIISTGGTYELLRDNNIAAKTVEEITGFPEILGGRVKTLHPNIHGGLLAKQTDQSHQEELTDNNIQTIDLVVGNLYPFQATVTQNDVTEEEIIENIDIGGPTMLRAAAKNFQDVTVVADPNDYEMVLSAIKNDELTLDKRKQLAAKVFRHTAQYDALIANYFSQMTEEEFPENYTVTYEKVQDLRYGENPHQQAVFYKEANDTSLSLASAKQLHGKELSFNNIQDANAALEIISEYHEPTAVAVKHMNPCGIGLANTINDAFTKAYEADPMSIFGGIVACNREIDQATAKQLHEIFLEIIIAPSFTAEAVDILEQKKNVRLLQVNMENDDKTYHQLSTVKGGMLVQHHDQGQVDVADLIPVTDRHPTEKEINDLLFAWKAVKHVKSNAIVLAKEQQTIGIGAGQMNRVGAAQIAIKQAGAKAQQSVLASDAFFPMPDTVEAAANAGVTAIIQPGGSKRDQDSIDVCNEHDIAMVFTKMRHFKH